MVEAVPSDPPLSVAAVRIGHKSDGALTTATKLPSVSILLNPVMITMFTKMPKNISFESHCLQTLLRKNKLMK